MAKHSKSHLLRTRGPAKVLRRKGGLDVAALQRRIRVAMDQPVEYNTITCNCVHFALALLGLGHLAGAMVGATIRSGATALGHLGTCSSQVSPNFFFPRCPQRCSDGGGSAPGEHVGLEHPPLGTGTAPVTCQSSCVAINSYMETLSQSSLICCFLTFPRSCCQVMSHLDIP